MKIASRRKFVLGFYFVLSVVIVLIVLPKKSQQQYTYVENRPWNHSLLTAPFDIPIFRDSTSVRILSDSIRENFVPVYKLNKDISDLPLKEVNANSALTETEKSKLKAYIEGISSVGIVDNVTASKITQGALPLIRVVNDNELRNVSTGQFRTQRQAYMLLDSLLRSNVSEFNTSEINLSSLVVPNVIYDSIENERLLSEALLQATAAIGVIQQGERIIDRGDIVNPQLYQVLLTYEEMMTSRDLTNSKEQFYTDFGAVLYTLLLFAGVYAYLFLYRKEWWDSDRRVLCILTLLLGFYVFAVLFSNVFTGGLLIIPFTILPILMVVFYDSRTALFVYMVELLLCLTLATFPLEFIFVEFAAGLIAIFSLKELSHRSQLLRTAAWVLLVYVVSYFAIELMTTGTINQFTWRFMGYFLINAVLISFAYIMIFVVEKLFGFTSMVTLVELSDINNPLLQELSEECPGTFQHSMAVSNLAAAAARKIGANVQLVRTGALYHDIGKLSNPAFFTENQHGVNPHDQLSPEQSAKMIIGHIKDGMKRAEKANLPKVVKDMITQHHGAGKAKYFYITACRKQGEDNVNPVDFMYPGPNPQTIESSLIMMADAVEAASRSLSDHSQQALTELVNRIIDSQISEGLHNDSPISFRDISLIKQIFINRLGTMYHARIAYPSEIKPRQ